MYMEELDILNTTDDSWYQFQWQYTSEEDYEIAEHYENLLRLEGE